MFPAFVIDASVIISWHNPQEQSDYARDILLCLRNGCAITTKLCCLETSNIMLLFEKRGILPPGAVEKAIESISDLPILLDDAPFSFNTPALLYLARRYNLTVYDAAYLELAVRLKIPLASLDGKLIEAAKAEKLALSI